MTGSCSKTFENELRLSLLTNQYPPPIRLEIPAALCLDFTYEAFLGSINCHQQRHLHPRGLGVSREIFVMI
jgi:hypothetical protein